MPTQTIEIDCPPMFPRPDSYIADILKDTEIPVREPVSTFFGCWEWDYSDIPADTWSYWNDVVKGRLIALYNSGRVRYCSW